MERTLPLQTSVSHMSRPARRIAIPLAAAAVIAASLAAWRLVDLVPRDDQLPFSCSLD